MRSFALLLLASTLALGGAAGCAGDDGSSDVAEDNVTISANERAAIMDGLRARVKPDLAYQDIVFNVSGAQGSLRMEGGWAFLMGTVETRGTGRPPTTAGTIYADADREGLFDGFRIEALLQKQGNRWVVVEHGIGTTDVWYWAIEERYRQAPRSIFPWLDANRVTQVAPSERMAVMNGLRATVKPDLANQDIVFNVSRGSFRVSGDYCWLQGKIELRGGGQPSGIGTAYQDAIQAGAFDGWRIEALLKKDGSNWRVLQHGIGSTDVWYSGIEETYPAAPRSIFPWLDGR